MLDKAIDVVRTCRDTAAARLEEIRTKDAEISGAYKQIEIYKSMVEKFDARIKYLEAIKCSERSLIKLFGLKIFHRKTCK